VFNDEINAGFSAGLMILLISVILFFFILRYSATLSLLMSILAGVAGGFIVTFLKIKAPLAASEQPDVIEEALFRPRWQRPGLHEASKRRSREKQNRSQGLPFGLFRSRQRRTLKSRRK
jgi:hypothetical protein